MWSIQYSLTIVPLLIVAAIIIVPSVATPPCVPIDHSVEYASPFWMVTFDLRNWSIPLETTFYWNGTYDPYISPYYFGPYVPIIDHVARPATSTESITFQDHDSDMNLTTFDIVQIWDPEVSLDYLRLGWGDNATSPNMWWQGFVLKDGYQFDCGKATPISSAGGDALPAAFLGLFATGAAAGFAVLMRRHKALMN